jgi:predicted nucleotidyltransferase
MSDRATLTAQSRHAVRAWAERTGCRLVVLFGSAASAEAVPPRDLDLAVSYGRLPEPEGRLRLIGELQDLCSPNAVDVVFLHPHTDPVLRFEIFRTGVLLHESRAGLFIDEVVRALSLYEDAIPFRRALQRTFGTGAREEVQ